MKRFLVGSALFLLPILALIAYYQFFMHAKFQHLSDIGDNGLALTGFVSADENYTTSLIKQFPEENEWRVLDYDKDSINKKTTILTIGDSFSQKRKGSYSNFLTYYTDHYNIVNYYRPINPFVIYWNLVNNSSDIPPIIIVETVERFLVGRLLDMDLSNTSLSIIKNEDKKITKELDRRAKRMSDYYRNLITLEKYRPVKHEKLCKDMFSCKNLESDLYIYHEDITITNSLEEIDIAAKKLDSLFIYAHEQGIQLFVLVAADRYDVYQSLIIDNPYPPKTVLDEMSSRVKSPNFIDTKQLFMPHVKQGVKDIYWCMDTHWSPVGAKIVAKEIARRLDSVENLEK